MMLGVADLIHTPQPHASHPIPSGFVSFFSLPNILNGSTAFYYLQTELFSAKIFGCRSVLVRMTCSTGLLKKGRIPDKWFQNQVETCFKDVQEKFMTFSVTKIFDLGAFQNKESFSRHRAGNYERSMRRLMNKCW